MKVEGMNNKGYGGEQNVMRASTIHSANGYLGPYAYTNCKLNVSDKQKMVFSADDEGPYWMSPEEREQTRKNQYEWL